MNQKSRSAKFLGIAISMLLILIVMACSSTPAGTTPTLTPTPSTTIQNTINVSSKSGLANYLVDGKGITLYWTTRDTVGKSNITGTTLVNWPIFYTASVVAPPSLKMGDFGSITRADGTMQSTYKGWPLYYYINDKAPGDTLGQGLASVWFVIDPTTNAPVAPVSSPTPTTSGKTAIVNLIAQNFKFNMTTITVVVGAVVTVNFNNLDSVPHNFALYQSGSGTTVSATGPIFQGQTISGPGTTVYTFTAPSTPGNYFFRCDIHPAQMFGMFIVTAN